MRSEAVGDVADTTGPAPEHVDQVVGVLGLAAVGESERLEHDEGSRSAHGDAAADGFSLQRVAVQGDFVAFVEGEFQSGGYESAKVAFKVVDAAARDSTWDRWEQEVDGDAEAGKLPALRCRVTVFVVVGREALLAQAMTDLGVLLIVEEANCQPDVEVVSAGMHVAGVRVRADLLVDEQIGDQAADDAQLAHQCSECHRDGQAYRPDLLSLLG